MTSRFLNNNAGGYDDGYRACSCFWGTKPGSLVVQLLSTYRVPPGARILDAGCGEGKNAGFLARRGVEVVAIDVSAYALRNGRQHWDGALPIRWIRGDVRDLPLRETGFYAVILYGLLHCLATPDEIRAVVNQMMRLTAPKGLHVVCSFNSRRQDLSAHPGFTPTLLSHEEYGCLYGEQGWELVSVSDADLEEVHPHNGLPHHHSMTRLVARKPSVQ